MPWKKPTKEELARILGVSVHIFHREIKPFIKQDFIKEIEQLGFNNPDIYLDEENYIILVNPTNPSTYFETHIKITDY